VAAVLVYLFSGPLMPGPLGKGATRGARGAKAPLSQVKIKKKDKKF